MLSGLLGNYDYPAGGMLLVCEKEDFETNSAELDICGTKQIKPTAKTLGFSHMI